VDGLRTSNNDKSYHYLELPVQCPTTAAIALFQSPDSGVTVTTQPEHAHLDIRYPFFDPDWIEYKLIQLDGHDESF
jgi:hypothetical protein